MEDSNFTGKEKNTSWETTDINEKLAKKKIEEAEEQEVGMRTWSRFNRDRGERRGAGSVTQ